MSNNRIDLKPDNVLVKIEDPSILERDALDEYNNPLPQKVMDDRTIYLSRNKYGPFAVPAGLIQISDFGFSVSGTIAQSGCMLYPSRTLPGPRGRPRRRFHLQR